jgi:signal transduction histidine kinase
MKNKKSTAPAKKKLPAKKTITTSVVKKANLANVDKLKAENLQLRDAVKRRTVELEQKNRELAIEAAMEKVRVRSLAMQKPEELAEVAEVLRNEMGALGVEELETSSIYIIDETKGTTECWYAIKDIRSKNKKLVTDHMRMRLDETWVGRQMNKFNRSKQTRTSILMKGENRKEWINYCAGKSSVLKGYYGGVIPERTYHLLKFSNGFMGAASPGAISIESWDLLQRATAVFSFAYKRFSDLQKAEAQAREAQIEAALERVRAKTMAMQRSDDLPDAALLLSNQVKELGVQLRGASFQLWDDDRKEVTAWSCIDGIMMPSFKMPATEDPLYKNIFEASQKGETLYVQELGGEALKNHNQYLTSIPSFNEALSSVGLDHSQVTSQFIHAAYFSNGFILIITLDPCPDSHEIFKRFAKVFEQTYTRFLDLQKAEAQAREAQIETALERVRSRSMGMHKSEELPEVIQLVFEQLRQLNFNIDSAQFDLNYLESDDLNIWTAVPGRPYPNRQHIPYFNSAVFNSIKHAKEAGLTLSAHNYTIEEKSEFFNHFFKHVNIPEERRKFILSLPGWARSVVYLDRIYLSIQNYSGIPYSEAEHTILMRFGKVFQQTYTRFLDLQKAEAQAREAQIQLALERVRAKTMAMQKSEELPQAANLLFQQVQSLGMPAWSAGYCIWDEDLPAGKAGKQGITLWMSSEGVMQQAFHAPLTEDASFIHMREAYERNDALHVEEVGGEALVTHYKYMRTLPVVGEILDSIIAAGHPLPAFQIFHCVYFSQGFLLFITYEPVPHAHDLFKRFGKVFDQTYTRFLDLQKAEAQAREAQIETALERVRSRTMAMQQSDELRTVVLTIYEQLNKLDFNAQACNIILADKTTGDREFWVSGFTQDMYPESYKVPYFNHPYVNDQLNAWKQGAQYNVIEYSGQLKKDFDKIFFTETDFKNVPAAAKRMMMETSSVMFSTAFFSHGSIQALGSSPLTTENADILKRFAKVFEQTYTRFLDLQKAEAQAREATIEAALEKVRGKAMAMHSSNDLMSTASVVFTELKKLGINSFRGGVALIDKESRLAKMYSATSSEEGATLSLSGTIVLDGHPVLSQIGDSMISQSDYFPVLKGELLESYITHVSAAFNSPLIKSQYDEWYGCFLPYSEGAFYVWSDKPFTESEVKILNRFNAIVDLTFRRYLELQRAEANALNALRSASLDRVRAEIASMRTKQDLERITPLIWKELTTLGIPFVRCGVFIMDEQEELLHAYLSTPDGKAIAALHLPYGSTPLAGAIEFWREKKIFLTHWGIKEYAEFADSFIDENETEKRAHYLSSVPKEGIHLHLLPFIQGMLYVGNTASLTEDNLHLVQSVADAFSTAYARYEDFNKIESAKAQIEKTLSDLKLTQAQLVQSEKMASLGELTAGIAHEIQNPLNFVNNFSEVSSELIDEMKTELATGNLQLVTEISNDLKQNLEKINHHGKRAADIIKGMLQHSRSSSGVKEPTNINALADEYLRLAYHGLRAKDKTFNATMKTEFDEPIGKLNIIPQDMGRVILNLITNAFYVVNEKSKLSISGYEPTVVVSTKLENGALAGITGITKIIKITVKDNGNGIPQKILDKIFQPFFTTKPTGQGTGLGLSLSYDIVKAHGGELRVETKEGEGSEFIIVLPL